VHPAIRCHVTDGLAVLGHYHLWVGGVHHNDISVENLMYDKANGHGILNDYDLAHLNGRPRPSGAERTGTMPFMALDLLTEKAWNGLVGRLYRHDCESFAWVLFWICCRYDDGKEINDPPLSDFITDSFKQCYAMKISTISSLNDIAPTPSYDRFWGVVRKLLFLAAQRRFRAACEPTILLKEAPAIGEDEPLTVVGIYRDALEENGFKGLLDTVFHRTLPQ
jgi:hypothetical protein